MPVNIHAPSLSIKESQLIDYFKKACALYRIDPTDILFVLLEQPDCAVLKLSHKNAGIFTMRVLSLEELKETATPYIHMVEFRLIELLLEVAAELKFDLLRQRVT